MIEQGNSSTSPMLALAPMQDVTDLAYMRTLTRIHCLPDFWVTPYFRSTRTTCAMSEGPLRCIMENPAGIPVWAQLAGSAATPLLRDAEALMRLPVAGINLNVGCPSPLVNRHGAGAGLLRKLPLLREIALALRAQLPPGAWSVKCRIGWERAEEFPRVLDALCDSHPDMLMVHARTRKQLYAGEPCMAAVRLAVQRGSCPVFANGDISSMEEARIWLNTVEPAGLMIGRGLVRNPYLLRELRGGSAPTAEEMQEYYAVLLEETGHHLERYTPSGHCNRMKKYLAFCYQDFSADAEYKLRRCTDPTEMGRLLQLARGGPNAS